MQLVHGIITLPVRYTLVALAGFVLFQMEIKGRFNLRRIIRKHRMSQSYLNCGCESSNPMVILLVCGGESKGPIATKEEARSYVFRKRVVPPCDDDNADNEEKGERDNVFPCKFTRLFLQFATNSRIKWRVGDKTNKAREGVVIGVVKFHSIRCFLYS